MSPTLPVSLLDSIRRHMVQLKMTRALEVVDRMVCELEQGQRSPSPRSSRHARAAASKPPG